MTADERRRRALAEDAHRGDQGIALTLSRY
jgi:hypothetical protein